MSNPGVTTSTHLSKTIFGILERYGRNNTNGIFFWVIEKEESHIHIGHICAYSNRSCRCQWKNEIVSRFPGLIKPLLRPGRGAKSLKRHDWSNVVIYFFYNKQQDAQVWISNTLQGLPTTTEIVRWKSMQDNATMVEGTPEINGYNIFKEQQSSSTNNTEVVRSRRNHYGQRENKFNRIYKKIFTLLKAKPVTPLTMITYCSEFQSDMELLDPSNDKKITGV